MGAPSGHHPFDYGKLAEGDEDESQLRPLNTWEEKMSLSYIRNDRRVRRRIVGEEAEFPRDTWGTLDDGMALLLGSSCTSTLPAVSY